MHQVQTYKRIKPQDSWQNEETWVMPLFHEEFYKSYLTKRFAQK